MRFTVSRVMDTIERRLTTDVTLAQAVVDVGEVARNTDLDRGRAINLIRLGMVIDALGRYLIDEGVMLYPVAARELLSENALTSKERMVLSRWADDGLIEVTAEVEDRVPEVADLTGLPMIVISPYGRFESRYAWLRSSPERSLWLRPKLGGAALVPAWEGEPDPNLDEPAGPAQPAVGKAPVPGGAGGAEPAGESGSEPADAPPDTFLTRGAVRVSSTLVAPRRFSRVSSSEAGARLLAREWRCMEPECPAFGGYRVIGQPVPRFRDGVATCPRHGTKLTDIGPRPAAYAIVVVVDDLARRRFAVDRSRAVSVGRSPGNPEDVSVGPWLHSLAAAWIAPDHLRLAVRDGRLVVTDTSENGTLLWRRSSPEDQGTTERLYHAESALGEWDSIELYTGVELVQSAQHRVTEVRGGEVGSVMVDAPTVVMPRSDPAAD